MELAKLTQAERLLAEARTVEDAVDIADKAEVMRVYAKKIGLGLEAQNHAAEIKVRAERKAGELLAEIKLDTGGGDTSGGSRVQPPDSPPKLADLGIEKTASHRYQTIAKLPAEDFEAIITDTIEKGDELTNAKVYRAAR